MNTPIRIGTRGSQLALWQAYYVQEILERGGHSTQIVRIDTKGDQILDRALAKIGSKGVFTQELEDQLRDGRIDVAVHSAKDLQSDLSPDLELIAFTERELVNDVLVSHNTNLSLDSGAPFVVGTSSTRRSAILRHFYPHIKIVDMRGNLQTRLRKLEDNHCDALLLAYAGVHRMKYDALIAQVLPIDTFTPAVGQGTVAIETAVGLDATRKAQIRSLLTHAPQITSPNDGSTYFIDRTEPPQLQLSCLAQNDVKEIYWYINDKLYQKISPLRPIFFTPKAGKTKISCSDDAGRSSDVVILVK